MLNADHSAYESQQFNKLENNFKPAKHCNILVVQFKIFNQL